MVTLLEIKTQSRQLSDMVDSPFITDPELTNYVNNSLKELYDLMVATYVDYYLAEPIVATLTSDAYYTLPSDFYKLRGVDRSFDGSGSDSSWYTLSNFNFQDRNKFNAVNMFGRTVPYLNYRPMGDKIKFIPPSSAENSLIRIWYIPSMTTLSSDSDEFNDVNGWAQYVIVDCAIKMKQKQNEDVSQLNGQKAALMDRIKAMAANRDAGSPERITDARGSGNILGWQGNPGSMGGY